MAFYSCMFSHNVIHTLLDSSSIIVKPKLLHRNMHPWMTQISLEIGPVFMRTFACVFWRAFLVHIGTANTQAQWGGGNLIFYIYIGLADFWGVKILKFSIFGGLKKKSLFFGVVRLYGYFLVCSLIDF